jgi:hypothetical protein
VRQWMRFPLDDREAWKDESRGPLRDALRLAREGERRTPTEDDRPSAHPFPGPKRKPIAGQLSLDGDEAA